MRFMGRGSPDVHDVTASYDSRMTLTLRRTVPIMLVALAFVPALRAQTVQNVATDLAQRWSASKAPPHCARLSALTSIERLQATFECVWQAPRTPPGGRLAGTIQSTTGLTVVTWHRPIVDPNDARRVRDSLVTALEANGLKKTPCGPEGNDAIGLWIGRAVAVHISRIVGASGVPRLQIIATTDLPSTSAIRCAPR